MVTMVMRMTVVGVTIFSLTRNSSTITMKTTEFSPVPTSALATPPRSPAAMRMLFSGAVKIGIRSLRNTVFSRLMSSKATPMLLTSTVNDVRTKTGGMRGATKYAPKTTPKPPGIPAKRSARRSIGMRRYRMLREAAPCLRFGLRGKSCERHEVQCVAVS